MMFKAKGAFISSLSLFPLLIISLLTSSDSLGKENTEQYQVEFLTEILTQGSLDADEEGLFGFELKYFLARTDPHHFFTAFGYLTDSDKEGSSVDILRLDVGGQYDLFTYWDNRSYFEYSLGMAYVQEEFSASLIDRDTTDTFNEAVYKASFGFGFEYFQSFSTKLYLTQYGDLGRTLGLSFSYSF